MTLFEYMSIATSLILSFSLARALTNLGPIFASEHRYWVHSLWVLGLLFYHASLFWQLWLYHDVEAWTLVGFLLLLLGPIMLLIGVSLLVPDDAVPDYRIYFESIRRPFYAILIVISIQPNILPQLVFDIPFFHPLFWNSLVFSAAAVAAMLLRKSSIDMVLVCFYSLGVVGGLFTIYEHETIMQSVEGLIR